MTVVLTILRPAEAFRRRVEAEAVLRSVDKRKACCCERPWPGGYGGSQSCGRCGRWIRSVKLIRGLRLYIEALSKVEDEQFDWRDRTRGGWSKRVAA